MSEWIRVKADVQPPVFLCERCGEQEPIRLPQTIKEFSKDSKRFIKMHKNCKGGENGHE